MAPRDKVMRDMPPPEPHMQGGGQRGGPRRWTGTGPRPARHIPWPEIFKHHQSVITGHLKMLDMVRKHTVEGSGNYHTIMPMVDRCKEMLNQFRQVSTNFVPPKNSFDAVPLGSSSASMYPGYSPADHIYGEASQEYGAEYVKAKKEGKEPKSAPDGPEYTVGHARVTKRKQLEEIHRKLSSDDGQPANGDAESPATESKPSTAASTEEPNPSASSDNPYFVIDTNPTPINIPDRTGATSHKSKKAKTKHEDSAASAPIIETEDISAEVDARMKAKEEKRKKKEKSKDGKEGKSKKRKRDTDDSTTLDEPAEAAAAAPPTVTEDAVVEKPKKKKPKKGEEAAESVALEDAGSEKKSKKEKSGKKDKKRAAAEDAVEGAAVNADGDAEGGKKKKRKKEKAA